MSQTVPMVPVRGERLTTTYDLSRRRGWDWTVFDEAGRAVRYGSRPFRVLARYAAWRARHDILMRCHGS